MAMRWLMTVHEIGNASPALAGWPGGIAFDLSSHWLALDPGNDNEPPHPNCLEAVRHWPAEVEVRRPDGTTLRTRAHLRSLHINFAYELRTERDAAGRMRNPWRQEIVLQDLNAIEVPPGSEIWGNDDIQAASELAAD